MSLRSARHCLVIVSSRLRITLATVVHAASSAGSSRLSRGDSPTLEQLRSPPADSGGTTSAVPRAARAARRSPCPSACAPSPAGTRRRAGSSRPCRLRAARAAPARAPLRRRSGRSAAPAPAAACWSARGGAVHFSRSGASKVASDAGGTVRFQNVYMPRR